MAKTQIEQIRELATDVRVLENEAKSFRSQLVDLKSADQKRQDEIAELRKENADIRRELAEVNKETAKEISAPKQQLQDHLAHYQEWDKRRWGLIVMAFSALLSSVTGLIVALVRK